MAQQAMRGRKAASGERGVLVSMRVTHSLSGPIELGDGSATSASRTRISRVQVMRTRRLVIVTFVVSDVGRTLPTAAYDTPLLST